MVAPMTGRPTSGNGLGEKLQALRAHIDRSLFRSAPSVEARIGSWKGALLVVAMLALAIFLQLFRVGPSNALHSLWAEDGEIFLQGALNSAFWHDVFATYAGYLVLVPRLIAEAANLFPLRDIPAAFAIISGAVVALSGLAVWFASAAHIRNPFLRGTLVALTILCPVAGLESVASASYVLWYMLFASFWLLIWRPATTRGAVLGGVFILLTGLSTPGLWFFAPLAGLRALAIRDRRDLILVGAYAAGAAAQVPVVALNTEAAVEPLWTSDIWTAFLQRIVDGAALGERAGGQAWQHLGWPFLIVLLIGCVAALAYGALHSNASARWFAAIAIPTSLAMFVVSVYQRAVGAQMIWPAGSHAAGGGRYAIVPALLLASVALVLVDRAARRRGASEVPWIGIAVSVVLLLGIATSFDVEDTPNRGTPPWEDALRSAAASCRSEGLSEVAVATSPPRFGVAIPCERLSSFSDAPAAR